MSTIMAETSTLSNKEEQLAWMADTFVDRQSMVKLKHTVSTIVTKYPKLFEFNGDFVSKIENSYEVKYPRD